MSEQNPVFPAANVELRRKGRQLAPQPAETFKAFSQSVFAEGAVSADGRVMGSYLHGMFSGDSFRQAFLKQLGAAPSATSYAAGVEDTLDRLAAHLEAHLDVDGLLALAR